MDINKSHNPLANFMEVYEYHRDHNYIIINQYINYAVAILTNFIAAFFYFVITKYGRNLATYYR